MKKIITLFTLLFITFNLNANETNTIQQKDFENKTVTVDLNGHKILQFSKSVAKIHFDSSEYVEADFLKDTTNEPLTTLKVKGKKIGKQNAVVTFYDDSIVTVKFNIVKNINDIIYLVSQLYPNIKVSQINDTVVLQGYVKNQTQKSKLIEIFKKYGIEEAQVIDLIKDNHSTKMVRVKLYVVQIDNDKGQQLINDWSLSGFDDGTTSISNIDFDANITSLTGGITAAASRLGSNFNIGLTLNYLKKNNAVRIVNESTLIMKENQESTFTSGGSFKVPTTSTADNGTTSSGYEDVEYGLNIKIKVDKIVENRYIDFTTEAESTEIDNDNVVDGIPGKKGNTITTNVLIEDGSTIVLAGILSIDNSKNEEKVPGLGDIPILGHLFTSSDTSGDNNDLVFFMTPEIIDPMNYDQGDLLNKKLNIIQEKDYKNQEKVLLDNNKLVDKEMKEEKEETSTFGNLFKAPSKPKMTPEEAHQKRVNEILGY